MIDFLIIFKVVSAYSRRRGLNDDRLGKTLDTCRDIASGESVPASWLLRAQTLAMRWWANIGLLALLPALPLGVILALIHPGHIGDLIVAVLVGIFAAVAVAALGQAPVQTYRSHITMRAVQRLGGQATRQPLQPESRGLPKKRDFWLAAVIPATVLLIVLVLRLQYPNGP